MDQLDKMIAFENGELERDEVIKLFQSLVDSGLAWSLQGFYGRTAMDLIWNGDVIASTPQAKAYFDREKGLNKQAHESLS